MSNLETAEKIIKKYIANGLCGITNKIPNTKDIKMILFDQADLWICVIGHPDGDRFAVDGLRHSQWLKLKDKYKDYVRDHIQQIRTLNGQPPQSLTDEEKDYLTAVMKPFRRKIYYVTKSLRSDDGGETWIGWLSIRLTDGTGILFPPFDPDLIYTGVSEGMHSLKDLGIAYAD